jgi:hypothetical protein
VPNIVEMHNIRVQLSEYALEQLFCRFVSRIHPRPESSPRELEITLAIASRKASIMSQSFAISTQGANHKFSTGRFGAFWGKIIHKQDFHRDLDLPSLALSFRLNVALQASRALAIGFVSLSFCISQVCMKTLAHYRSPLRQESNGFNASQ